MLRELLFDAAMLRYYAMPIPLPLFRLMPLRCFSIASLFFFHTRLRAGAPRACLRQMNRQNAQMLLHAFVAILCLRRRTLIYCLMPRHVFRFAVMPCDNMARHAATAAAAMPLVAMMHYARCRPLCHAATFHADLQYC